MGTALSSETDKMTNSKHGFHVYPHGFRTLLSGYLLNLSLRPFHLLSPSRPLVMLSPPHRLSLYFEHFLLRLSRHDTASRIAFVNVIRGRSKLRTMYAMQQKMPRSCLQRLGNDTREACLYLLHKRHCND